MLTNDDFTIKRKQILERIDKNEQLSILELGMYNLTPYFKEVSDTNLSETIMLNQNLERGIKHLNEEFYFSPPQEEALSAIINNRRIIISAPTSFGKTLIVKEFIFTQKPKNIVYIVPTNALAYELEKSFKQNLNFSDYTIFDRFDKDKDKGDNYTEKLFFIGTQEKYLELDDTTFLSIDLFVIDEAYKLEESTKLQRGYKLSETFLHCISIKTHKIVLITPQAKFKGFDEYEFKTFESNFNCVEKNYNVLDEKAFYDVLIEKSKMEKSILFCKTPAQMIDFLDSIKEKISDVITDDSFIQQLSTDIHPQWSVVKLLRKGILTHHGQMPKYIQNKMINLFNSKDNEYKLLLGTNSISEGINTATKNLFISPKYTNVNKNLLLLKNTIGRAGRLGEYPIGYIYSVQKIEECVEKEISIELSVCKDEELERLQESKDETKIKELADKHKISVDFCKKILDKYKLSLQKLNIILEILKKNLRYDDLSNLPYLAQKVYSKEYSKANYDCILIKGYLQGYFFKETKDGKEKVYLNNFNNMIEYYKLEKQKKNRKENKLKGTSKHYKHSESKVINYYMQFIYSALEYYIMPIVNVGIDIHKSNNSWEFGKNVVSCLEKCKNKYYKKTFGNLNVDDLPESHVKIITTLKDYGLSFVLRRINETILSEIEENLNVRYSTIDVLNAIKKLSTTSRYNKDFYKDICTRYIN